MKHIPYFTRMLLCITVCFAGCAKDKLDHLTDNRVITDARSNSDIRVVNLAGDNQVILNGDTLTNYVVMDPLAVEYWKYPPTKFFPKDGRLGATWTIPRQLLKADGTARLKVENKGYASANEPAEFDVQEDYSNPADYYLLHGPVFMTSGPPQVVKIPRSVVAPAQPDHFKIRIVNLTGTLIPQADPVDNFAVPLTLTWADGTPVNNTTSGIAPGAWSDYVELPYGTYQFKVLDPNGLQVSASGGNGVEQTDVIDPGTATLTKPASGRPHTVSTSLTYAPIHTYQPGGIYTIVISANTVTIPYYVGNPGETVSDIQNTFNIITDATEQPNLTYARIQAVNALPGSGNLRMKVNGVPVTNGIGYTAQSSYITCVTGDATIEAQDQSGKTIASMQLNLAAGQNYTAWINPAADNTPRLTMVMNDLSGSYFVGGGDGQDGSAERAQYQYPFNIRFLNFCPDAPYVNFTMGNGQPFPQDVTSGLQPGIIPVQAPYVRFSQQQPAYQIMAYQSTPGIFPGAWMSGVPVLNSSDFIARKALYVRGTLPVHEPGVFSVALVGSTSAGAPEAARAKMIIVKHTK